MDQTFWDQQYQESGQRWSGRVNGALRAEVEGLRAGTALDLGCGEGGDARWLAQQGWQVTAVDISPVALERAAAATDADAAIEWRHADARDFTPPSRSFDLVFAMYFFVAHEPGHQTVRGIIDAVRPGGTLLMVSHPLDGQLQHQHESPEYQHFDLREYYQPAEFAELLDSDWVVEVNESRPRPDVPQGNPHQDDVVLRARRLR